MEIWLPVVGFESCYEVSSLGNVRSLDRIVRNKHGLALKKGKKLKPQNAKDGYLSITLSKNGKLKSFLIHRLVATSFIGVSNYMEVNHIDFDKRNNSATNLEWCTRQQNQDHAILGGKFSRENRVIKVTKEIADKVRIMREEGAFYSSIANKFSISKSTVRRIIMRETFN